jgi:hypothetical protein
MRQETGRGDRCHRRRGSAGRGPPPDRRGRSSRSGRSDGGASRPWQQHWPHLQRETGKKHLPSLRDEKQALS